MCIHTINEYPFCGEEKIDVTAEDAIMHGEGEGNQMCRKYSFSACEKLTRTGRPCIKDMTERKYREAIEARKDSIIRVHFTDCNMLRNVKMGCKVGNGRRTTDNFNRPLLIGGVPHIGPQRCPKDGAEGEKLIELIRGRERN